MLIRLGYDIERELSRPMTVIAVLNVHRSRVADLVEPDEVRVSHCAARDEYVDTFGNRCLRQEEIPNRKSGSPDVILKAINSSR
jgi:hypothetical protein